MTFARMIGLVLFGIVASVLLLAPLLLSGVFLTRYVWKETFTAPSSFFPPSPVTVGALVVTLVFVFLLIVSNRFLRMNKLQSAIETTAVFFLCVSTLSFLLELLPPLLRPLQPSRAGAPGGLPWERLWTGTRSQWSRARARAHTWTPP